MHSATATPRLPASLVRRRAAARFALAGLTCLAVGACSPGADYPSLFPSVHDTPPPRADTPLDQNQVQQATEDLITARDRLTAEAQSGQGKSATGSNAKPAAKSPSQSSAKSANAGKPAGNSTAGAQVNAPQALGTQAGQAAAGSETK